MVLFQMGSLDILYKRYIIAHLILNKVPKCMGVCMYAHNSCTAALNWLISVVCINYCCYKVCTYVFKEDPELWTN